MSSPWSIVDQPGTQRCRLIHTDAKARGLGKWRDGTMAIADRPALEQMVADGSADTLLRIHGLAPASTPPRGPRIEVVGGHGRAVHRREMGVGARR